MMPPRLPPQKSHSWIHAPAPAQPCANPRWPQLTPLSSEILALAPGGVWLGRKRSGSSPGPEESGVGGIFIRTTEQGRNRARHAPLMSLCTQV